MKWLTSVVFAPSLAQDAAAMRGERAAADMVGTDGTFTVLSVLYVTTADELRSVVLQEGKREGKRVLGDEPFHPFRSFNLTPLE